jgi:hypothetical protein
MGGKTLSPAPRVHRFNDSEASALPDPPRGSFRSATVGVKGFGMGGKALEGYLGELRGRFGNLGLASA